MSLVDGRDEFSCSGWDNAELTTVYIWASCFLPDNAISFHHIPCFPGQQLWNDPCRFVPRTLATSFPVPMTSSVTGSEC